MKFRVPSLLLAASLSALGMATIAAPATEATAQRGLRARIYITQARIPRRLSERGLIRFVRGHHARRMRETTGRPIAERDWRGEMVVAFNRSPGDLEFHVLFYDLEAGTRRFVHDMSTFVNDRSQKTFLQRLRLPRGENRHTGFQPNHRMELVVTVRRREVGRLRFELRGEEIRRTGQVEFSEEEAR